MRARGCYQPCFSMRASRLSWLTLGDGFLSHTCNHDSRLGRISWRLWHFHSTTSSCSAAPVVNSGGCSPLPAPTEQLHCSPAAAISQHVKSLNLESSRARLSGELPKHSHVLLPSTGNSRRKKNTRQLHPSSVSQLSRPQRTQRKSADSCQLRLLSS